MKKKQQASADTASALQCVEICAGAGGQSLGLHLAGFRHSLAVELDENAATTLRTNLSRLQPGDDAAEVVAVGDVADEDVWTPEDWAGVDLLAGGVPCPPFSRAGRQLGASDERDLFAWAISAAGRIRPKAVMLENVRGMADARFGGYRQAVVDTLADLGYVSDWQLLEARHYGVPQLRPRMVLVALQEEYVPYFSWPEPKATTETVGTRLAQAMGSRGFPYLEEWIDAADRIAPTIVGGSRRHGGADLGPTRAKRAWAELWVDGHGLADEPPGPDWDRTLPAHQRGPRLTVDMVAQLQGWHGAEYAWEFTGRKTSRYRQVGNAFPPPVARAVGESIARALRKEGQPSEQPPERRMHDEVYRLLRDCDGWATAERLSGLLGGRISAAEVKRRIRHIGQDFEVESRSRGGRTSYRLGQWRAFQGQDDHVRHDAFRDKRARARIS